MTTEHHGDAELIWTSGSALVERMRHRDLSSVEVVDAFLDRIGSVDGTLNAFISIDEEGARRQAREADDRAGSGEELGTLHGLPVAVKDNLWTSDLPTTSGSKLFDANPPNDCITVERLRGAGAIVVGKTNLPEFSAWPRTVSRVKEECVNPWNPGHVSGASSGGSAAAAAAAEVPVAIGTDGGGSTRLPAALNGVVGVQPSKGIVPSWGRGVGAGAFAGIGPMSRDVRDAARVLTTISGPDSRDPLSEGTRAVDYEAALDDGVRDMALAWLPTMGDFAPNPRLTAVVESAIAAIEESGANVEESKVRFDGTAEMFFVLNVGAHEHGGGSPGPFQMAEVREVAADPERRELLSPYIVDSVDALSTVPAETYHAAVRWLDECERRLASLFEHFDYLLCPTAPFVAPRRPDDPWAMPWESMGEYVSNTALANLLLLTAVTVPCGFHEGLPVGLQIIGPGASEAGALRVARALEVARPWAHHRPPEAFWLARILGRAGS